MRISGQLDNIFTIYHYLYNVNMELGGKTGILGPKMPKIVIIDQYGS